MGKTVRPWIWPSRLRQSQTGFAGHHASCQDLHPEINCFPVGPILRGGSTARRTSRCTPLFTPRALGRAEFKQAVRVNSDSFFRTTCILPSCSIAQRLSDGVAVNHRGAPSPCSEMVLNI
jgi:hypothetical protein